MFGKFFISFLFLGLVAVQASPISPVHEMSIEEFIDFSEIIEKIKQIIEAIKNAIGNLPGSIQEIIQKIKDKINEIIGSGSMQEVIKKIVEIIKGMIGEAGEKVNQCIQEEMPEITEIAQNQQQQTMECVNAAQGQIEELSKQASGLKDEAVNIGKKALADAAMCLISGQPKACLEGVASKTMEAGKALIEKGKGLVSQAQDIFMQVGLCSQKVQEETAAKLQEVYKKIVNCVATYDDVMLIRKALY